MTLLREIQLLLERTYAPVPINLEHCLIGERRCAALTQQAGATGLAPAGRTFLRQSDDALYVAIFYAQPVIAALETHDPRRTLNERNIAPLITFIEEIAHAVQAALLFAEGERRIETEAYACSLETQARIDTYLVLSKLAALISGGTISRRVGRWLRRQVFDGGYRHFADPVLRTRYRAAERCALAFLRRLRPIPLPERGPCLREFRALGWDAKQQFAFA